MSSESDSDVREVSEERIEEVEESSSGQSGSSEEEEVDVTGSSDEGNGREIGEASSSRNPQITDPEQSQSDILPYTEIRSTVTSLELEGVIRRCHIPKEYKVRIPRAEERMHNPPRGSIAMPLQSLYCGFRLPIPEPMNLLIGQIGLNPTQLLPNSYSLMMAFIVLMRCWAQPASFSNYVRLFSCQPSSRSGSANNAGFYYITSRPKKKIIDIPSSSYGKGWKSKWVIIEPPSSRPFNFRRNWATGKVNNRSREKPSWSQEFFETMLEMKPLRPQELCEEIVLARAGLSPAKFESKDLESINLGPDFIMASRDRAIEAARAKKEGKGKKAEEGSSRRPGAGKPLELLYSGQISKKAVEPSASTKKRPAPKESSPPPAKKPSVAEKGKAPASGKAKAEETGSAKVIKGPLPILKLTEERADRRVYQIPEFEEPERNELSLFENLGHSAGWEAFRSTLFPADLATSSHWKTHDMIRIFGHFSVMANNLAFELAQRAHGMQKAGRELQKENLELKQSGSLERVKELESLLEEEKAERRAREAELSEAEKQITDLVSDKSRLEELSEKQRRESLEAFRRGEEKGKKVASDAKDEEFKRALPTIRLQAVEGFVRGPVFTRSTLLVGANDVDSGWNRALGQIRALGVNFDESKLDKSLDKNLQPFVEEEDDEDAFPDVEGHEFESILDIVEEMVDRAREKEEAAGARRAEAEAEVVQVAAEGLPRAEVEHPAVEKDQDGEPSTSAAEPTERN